MKQAREQIPAVESPADRLDRMIRERGFDNAHQFAVQRGLNPHTVYSHVQGRRALTVGASQRYAAALGCTADYLLKGNEAGKIEIWLSAKYSDSGLSAPLTESTQIPPAIGTLTEGDFFLAYCEDPLGPFFPRGTVLAAVRLDSRRVPPPGAPVIIRERNRNLSRIMPWFPAGEGKYVTPSQPAKLTKFDADRSKEIVGFVIGFWYTPSSGVVTL